MLDLDASRRGDYASPERLFRWSLFPIWRRLTAEPMFHLDVYRRCVPPKQGTLRATRLFAMPRTLPTLYELVFSSHVVDSVKLTVPHPPSPSHTGWIDVAVGAS